MDQYFIKDKFTKSNYSFVNRNKPDDFGLNDEQMSKVEQLHANCRNQVSTFCRKLDFNLSRLDDLKEQLNVNKPNRSKSNREEINYDEIFKNVLIKLSVKDEQGIDKLGSESPFYWFLLDTNEIHYSIKLLDDELKQEGFYERPVDWLIAQGMIRSSRCTKCKNEHQTYQQKGTDHYWVCKENDCPQKRMELFDNLSFCKNSIKELPLLILNWAIYSNLGLIKQSKNNLNPNFDSNLIVLVIDTFRLICRRTNEASIGKLGTNGQVVELYCCIASNLLVVFAYESDTAHIKFKVIGRDEIAYIVSMFKEWFHSSVNLVIYEEKFDFLREHFKVERRVFEDKEDGFLNTVFNIVARNVVPSILEPEIFTSFLHEITWRVIYGKTPYSAFKYMINLILMQPLEYEFYLLDLVSRADTNVNVDEIYYGRYEHTRKPNLDPKIELRNNIRCHQCHIPFNFLTIPNHLMSHFTVQTRRKPGSIDTTCAHCFTRFTFTELQLHRDLIEGNFKRKNLISSCKICCKVFKTKQEYILHLKNIHRYQDHPYSCSICPFRTSFYHEKLSHYRTYHLDFIKGYCKYCLMVFVDDNASEQLFDHFKKHNQVRDQFDCSSCALSFVDKESLNRHFLDDHILQTKKSINFTVKRFNPKVSDEDDVLKIEIPKNTSINKIPVQQKTRDGRKVRLTKKNYLKLRCEAIQHDNILNKDFIVFGNKLVTCLECMQPIDTNHLTKKPMKCNECDYVGHCVTSIKYPCGLHMSGLFRD